MICEPVSNIIIFQIGLQFGGRSAVSILGPHGRTLTVSGRRFGPSSWAGLRPPFWDYLLVGSWGRALLWLCACSKLLCLMGSRRNVGSFVWGFAFAGALLFVVVRLRTKKSSSCACRRCPCCQHGTIRCAHCLWNAYPGSH